jgi:hypothetical protein
MHARRDSLHGLRMRRHVRESLVHLLGKHTLRRDLLSLGLLLELLCGLRQLLLGLLSLQYLCHGWSNACRSILRNLGYSGSYLRLSLGDLLHLDSLGSLLLWRLLDGLDSRCCRERSLRSGERERHAASEG